MFLTFCITSTRTSHRNGVKQADFFSTCDETLIKGNKQRDTVEWTQSRKVVTHMDRTLVCLHFCTQAPLWTPCCRQNHPEQRTQYEPQVNQRIQVKHWQILHQVCCECKQRCYQSYSKYIFTSTSQNAVNINQIEYSTLPVHEVHTESSMISYTKLYRTVKHHEILGLSETCDKRYR